MNNLQKIFWVVLIFTVCVWIAVGIYYLTTTIKSRKIARRQPPLVQLSLTPSLTPHLQHTVSLDTLLEEIFPAKDYLIVDHSTIDLETFEGIQDGKTVVVKLEGPLIEKDESSGFWKVFRSESGNMGKAIGFPVHEATKFYQKISGSQGVQETSPNDFKEGDMIGVYNILNRIPPKGGAILILK